MNLGKILLSASMIAFVGAAAFTGTGAFFSDTETSTGNTFTAGEIDLTVDSVAHYNGLVCFEDRWVPEEAVEWDGNNEELVGTNVDEAIAEFNIEFPNHFPQAGDECEGTWTLTDLGPTHTFFNYGDLKPGDDGENTLSLHLDTNDGYVCAIISNLVDNDNGLTEPEEEDGDNTGGDGEGELSSELRFFAWADDGDNIWEEDEQVLFSNTEGPASDVIDGVSYDLFTPANGQIMPAGETAYIGLYWCYGDITVNEGANTLSCDGASVTNVTQTDSMTADISFYVEQARNNENFTCPDPDEFGGDERIEVTQGESWAPNAASQTWFAKAKVQEPNPASDFEVQVGVGDANPADFDQGDTEYVDETPFEFTLVYDSGTGIATFTSNGVVTTYAVGTTSVSNIGITARAPSNATTTVDSLILSTGSLSDTDLVVANGTAHLSIPGASLNSGFTLSGDITFDWETLTANGENQKVQISIN